MVKLILTIVLFCFAVCFGTAKKRKETLIFYDEFNSFDLSKWKHEITMGSGNNEFQQYVNSRENSFVKDGKLLIRPTLTEDVIGKDALFAGQMDIWGNTPADQCTGPQFFGCFRETKYTKILNPIQSARIRTAESFSFKFGRVEISAKLPKGDWLWPGIWLFPMYESYGSWPSSGEIDIMEARGNGVNYISEKYGAMGHNHASSCIHFGTSWDHDGYPAAVKEARIRPDNDTYADGFHVYGFYWDDKEMYTYIDTPENVVVRVDFYGKKSFFDVGVERKLWNKTTFNPYQNADIRAPFDQEMYLIMNLAVGGTSGGIDMPTGYFPDGLGNKPWNTTDRFPSYNFYKAKDQWYNTWKTKDGEISSFEIDSVRIWGFDGLSTWNSHRNQPYVTSPVSDKRTCKHGTFGECYDENSGVCYVKTDKESSCYNGTSPVPSELIDDEQVLIFEDNFNEFSLSRWKHDISMSTSINNDDKQFQMFVNRRQNTFVDDGALHITPTLTSHTYGEKTIRHGRINEWGTTLPTLCTGNKQYGCDRSAVNGNVINPIISGHLRTSDSFSFKYGRVEIVAKLPKGDWLMPYFRLVPRDNHYGNWPLSGSIDIFSARGNSPEYKTADGRSLGVDSAFSCIHYGSDYRSLCNSSKLHSGETYNEDYHTFGLYWDDSQLFTYIDNIDNVVLRVKEYGTDAFQKLTGFASPTAPFDKEMYLSTSLVAGGSSVVFPDGLGGKPWNDSMSNPATSFLNAQHTWYPTWNADSNKNSASLVIDSIRIFAIPGKSQFVYHSNHAVPQDSQQGHKSKARRLLRSQPNENEQEKSGIPKEAQKPSRWRPGEKKNDKYKEILVFSDDFSDGLDLAKWKPVIGMDGGGNREFQAYVNDRRNLFVKLDKLHLKPTLTRDVLGDWMIENGTYDMWGTAPANLCTGNANSGCIKYANKNNILNPTRSARVRTSESFSFTYGRVEIVAKLPKGDWLWPGMWLMPMHDTYGTWPASGEIDLMESRGNAPSYRKKTGQPMGRNIYASNAHFGPAWNKNGFPLVVTAGPVAPENDTYADDFHTFGFFWDDERMCTYLDDVDNVVMDIKEYGKKSFWQMGVDAGIWSPNDTFNPYAKAPKHAPFDQAMYLIFNVAVGGTAGGGPNPTGFFPDDLDNKPWKQHEPYPAKSFYNRKNEWYPTWTQGGDQVSDDAAMQIDSVKIWAFEGKSTWDYHRLAGDIHVADPVEKSEFTAVYPGIHTGSKFSFRKDSSSLTVKPLVLSLAVTISDQGTLVDQEDQFIQHFVSTCSDFDIPNIEVLAVQVTNKAISASIRVDLPINVDLDSFQRKLKTRAPFALESFATIADDSSKRTLASNSMHFFYPTWVKYVVVGVVLAIVMNAVVITRICWRKRHGYQEIPTN